MEFYGLVFAGGIAALAFLPTALFANTLWRSVLKAVPLTLFAVAGILAGAPWWLVVGLALSAFGDFMLSRDGQSAFLVGLVAFALAHVAYITHFVFETGRMPWEAFQSAPLLAVPLMLIVASTEFWLSPHTGEMRWPVRGYSVIIATMGLSVLAGSSWIALVGAAMFIASDLLLAVDLFLLKPDAPQRRLTSYPLWVLYVAGQACLLLDGVQTSA